MEIDFENYVIYGENGLCEYTIFDGFLDFVNPENLTEEELEAAEKIITAD